MVFLGIKYFSWHSYISIKCGQAVFAYNTYFEILFFVQRPDVFNNDGRVALLHHKDEIAGNQIYSLRGFLFIDVQNNLFFPLDDKVCQYAEKKDYAGQNYPEKCFSKTFYDAASYLGN